MMITFKTRADAIQVGYRVVNHKTDEDISGGNYFGYAFRSPDGEETVAVWFTEQTNKIGGKGCFEAMYPPSIFCHY